MFPINKGKIHTILNQYNCERSANIESLYQSKKNINCHIFIPPREVTLTHTIAILPQRPTHRQVS